MSAGPAATGDLSGNPEPGSRSGRSTTWRRWLRVVLIGGAGLVVVVAAFTGWLLYDALRARDALQDVVSALPQLQKQIQEHPDDFGPEIEAIQDSARTAADATRGWHWTVARWFPWVGDNTRAFQTIAASADRVAAEVLPAAARAAQLLASTDLTPEKGRLNLELMVELRDPVNAMNAATSEVTVDVAKIPRANLVEPIAEAADQLTTQLTGVGSLTEAGAVALELAPPMLGQRGAREWLILAQNNAEPRATGGIPGAVLKLRADRGRLTIENQIAGNQFGPYREPILPLTDAEQQLFGDQLGTYMLDVNLTPDFPRTAALAQAIWREETGEVVQGVISLDPVALQGMLAATGPVTFSDPLGKEVTLTAENTASFLMSEVYTLYPDPETQDLVFALAAKAILDQLTAGGTDPVALLQAFSEIVADSRLMVWSGDEAEQLQLQGYPIAGALSGLAEDGELAAPVAGVFLNLTSASKLGYYLDLETTVTDQRELQDGAQGFVVRVRLTSRLESEAVADLPSWVRGNGPADGSISTNLLVYAPAGGDVSAPFGGIGGILAEHDGLRVSALTVVVPPAGAVELEWEMTSGPGQPAPVQVRLTPGARPS